MKAKSAKAKGRRHQQWLAAKLLKIARFLAPDVDIEPEDIVSTAMGVGGADIQLSTAARKIINIDWEAKNVQNLNIWAAIDQAVSNSKKGVPAVCFTKNGRSPWVAMSFKDFSKIVWGFEEVYGKDRNEES